MAPPSGLSESRAMSSSAPPDAEPNGFAKDAIEGEGASENYPIQLPDGLTERQLIEFATKKKKDHERWFGTSNGFNELITNWWKAYDGKTMPGQTSPSTVPLSNSIVETDTAKTYQAMFSRAKVVDAQPRVPQADNENKTTIEDLINQELLFGLSRTGEKAFDILKALKIEGTGIGRVKWEKRFIETITVPMKQDIQTGLNIALKTVAEAKTFQEVHGPDFDPEPVQNLIWDHRVGTRIQDSEFVGHRQFPTLTDLLIMQENGEITHVDAIQKLASSNAVEQGNLDQKRKTMLGPGGSGPAISTTEEPERRLDEWFAWVPYQAPQEDGSKKWTKVALHWMVVNDEVLVLCEPDPWVDESGHGPGHPFFSYRQSIHPREMLGKSVLAPVLDLQTYVNNIQDSMGKLTKKAAKNPTFVSRAAGLDTLRMFQDELALVPVIDPKAITYHPIDGAQIKAVAEERGWAINMARETVAANEQAQGVPTTQLGNATATMASIINANSGTRFQFIVDQLGYEFFAALGNLYWWMIRQWAEDGDLVVRQSTIDGAPRPITRAHLQDDYFFVPITSSVLNDQRAQLQSKMQFAQQMAQLQATNPGVMVDQNGAQYHFELMDFILKEIMPLMGVRNGRSYLQKEQPLPQGLANLAEQSKLQGGAAPGAPQGLPPGPIPPEMAGQQAPAPPPAAAMAAAPQPGFGPQGPFEA